MKRIRVTATTEYTPDPLYFREDEEYTIEEIIVIYLKLFQDKSLDEVFSGDFNLRLEIVDDTESNGR